MQTMEQIARADVDRRAYLDVEARKSRERKRSRRWVGFKKGRTKFELPTNWEAIDNAILKYIKHEYMHELRAIAACVASNLGIAPSAVGRELGVTVSRMILDLKRQRSPVNSWMKAEAIRIAGKCPRPVFKERKDS